MLTVTPAAGAALAELLASPTVPAGAAARLTHASAPDGEPAIGLVWVSDPHPGDHEVAIDESVVVFVDPLAADALEHHELDVDMDGDRIGFCLRPRQDIHP